MLQQSNFMIEKANMKNILSVVFIVVFIHQTFAQTYLVDPITSVHKGETPALYPFAGGLNNPQFNVIDFTADGIKDLVIFDRNGGKILPFINGGTPGEVNYVYYPQGEKLFPPMKYWCVFADYNCDGLEDIFTANEFNVFLYMAVPDGGLHYELVYDKVKYHEAGFTFFLDVGTIDIPGFVDVNFDGDLDILTFNFSGGVVDYFENMRVEEGLPCDTFKIVHADGCWGSFFESGLEKAVDLDYSCKGITSEKSTAGLHAGSTFLCFDEENDGDIDIVLGDLAFGNLNMLTNGGNATFAEITAQDTTFPAYNVPFEQDIFPAPFLIDIDNDGKRDMLVAPNKENSSENFKNVTFYKNTSADETFFFTYQQDSLFVSDMVDAGEGSRAVFFDYNADGLKDIVIGNNGYYNNGDFTTGLAVYENTGSSSEPSYTLVTRDYFNISIYGFRMLAPAFADLDADGDDDLLLGESSGFLHFFRNTAADGNPADFSALTEANYLGIDVGQNATPQIIDVNDDALPDLLIGEANGNLNYYQNIGTTTTPAFTLISNLWGNVDVRVPPSTTGNSVPFLMKSLTDPWKLFVGSENGTLFTYEPTTDLTGTFTLLTNSFSDIDEGSFSSVYFADITDDGSPELLTGNYRGGITLYREEGTFDAVESIVQTHRIFVYPNPAFDKLHIKPAGQLRFLSAEMFDVAGNLIMQQTITDNNIYLTGLQQGLYLLRLTAANGSIVIEKICKL